MGMASLDRCPSGEHAAAAVSALPPVMGSQSETLGPWGPYNPAPAWIKGHVEESEKKEPCEFEGRQVVMVRGKYKGRTAFVQRRVNKKYRLQVDGVAWGLEFYPNMFQLPSAGRMGVAPPML